MFMWEEAVYVCVCLCVCARVCVFELSTISDWVRVLFKSVITAPDTLTRHNHA